VSREISVDYLARVEGEGALYLAIDGDKVTDLRFRIFEPPRFFEAFLRGRNYLEAPDITARICGICPVAYQTSSANAMEDWLGVELEPGVKQLRHLMYLGEWIESHCLHVYMLHAPDFLGYQSGIHMAKDHPEAVTRGLRLKAAGNRLMQLLGGREIHPVNFRVGGFYRAFEKAELAALTHELEWGREAAAETVDWVSGFPFPDIEIDYEFVALRHSDEYAIVEGRIVSSTGLDLAVSDWPAYFAEEHVEWSNALHARRIGGGSYQVGPMARYNLNFEQLHPAARAAAAIDDAHAAAQAHGVERHEGPGGRVVGHRHRGALRGPGLLGCRPVPGGRGAVAGGQRRCETISARCSVRSRVMRKFSRTYSRAFSPIAFARAGLFSRCRIRKAQPSTEFTV